MSKNSYKSRFMDTDKWDEQPLVLKGKFKLQVIEALYAAQHICSHHDFHTKNNPNNMDVGKEVINPIILELEWLNNINSL